MKALNYLLEGKINFFPSFFIGGFFATMIEFISTHTPSQIFGYSITMWFIALAVNAWDIYTGIKADTKEQKAIGKEFQFNPDKGQKAFEKIFGFTVIIWILYSFELEAMRLKYPETVPVAFNVVKSIFFVYVILIELQSIGNNNEVRFGDKGKLFKMLDTIIAVINDGIIKNLKKLIGIADAVTETEKTDPEN